MEAVISNNSNKDYLDTRINLVEGEINNIKTEQVNNYSKLSMSRSVAPQSASTELGDYHIYSACLLYTSPSPRDATLSRMPSSA